MEMKIKRIGCLTIVGCIIVSVVIYFFTTQERVYYIPESDLYIRISVVPKDNYGYIYFSKSKLDAFKTNDYLKMYKALDNVIIEMYLKANEDTIFYIPLNKTNEIKQTDFVFVEKERWNSDVFYYDGTSPLYYKVKPEYVKMITLYDFNSDIYVSQDSSKHMKKLEPINMK